MRAWATLQENNAIALIDLFHNPPRVTDVVALRDKDNGLPENALDVNESDGPNRAPYPKVSGMYQPDGIEIGLIDGKTYLFTANEGDARNYGKCINEEERVSVSNLDPAIFQVLSAESFSIFE